MPGPTVTRIPGIGPNDPTQRYHISGGTLAPDWAEHHAKRGGNAYCMVSLWAPANWEDGPVLGSYGGAVWPTAWPELFETIDHGWPRGKMLTGRLTMEGRRLFGAADAALASARRDHFPSVPA